MLSPGFPHLGYGLGEKFGRLARLSTLSHPFVATYFEVSVSLFALATLRP